jgi:glycosyltransferase involved in cell wall biosynthesis
LQKCVSSIESAFENIQNSVDIEIIVVFNGVKNDGSSIIVKRKELLKVLNIAESNVSQARNYGIRNSGGEYVVLIDDDAEIHKEFIVILGKVLGKYPAKVFCARILEPITGKYFTDDDRIESAIRVKRLTYTMFKGSAIIAQRSVLIESGLYDPDFGPGGKYRSGEESDLFFKILKLNEPVLFVPELIIYHPISYETPPAKAFNYSYATGAVLMKYCFYDISHILVYCIVIIRILIKSALRVIQFKIFPKSIEAKNYQFRYNQVFTGTISGMIDYIKLR